MNGDVLREWAKASGFNMRQQALAAESIGMTRDQWRARVNGRAQVQPFEMLALSAAYLGLPPWRPGFADALDDDARLAIDMARRQVARCLAAHATEGRALPEGAAPNTSSTKAA